MTLLCAALLAGNLVWQLPGAERFDLVWIHSVEKVEWRETWVVEKGALHLVTVRVKGSGAGMEPPPNARLLEGWWVSDVTEVSYPTVTLARSGVVSDYSLCLDGGCRPLVGWLSGLPEIGSLVLSAC